MQRTNVQEIVVFLVACGLVIVGLYALGLGVAGVPLIGIYRSPDLDVCDQFSKRQWVRLLDIFVLGPMGIYIGYKIWKGETQDLGKYLGLLIIIYGMLTVVYNGGNYAANVKRGK